MLKKTISALLCSVIAVSAMVSCGKQINVDDSSSSPEATKQAGTQASGDFTPLGEIRLARFFDRTAPDMDFENSSVKNFTTPKNGDQIIIMKFKDYDQEVKIRLFPEYAQKGVENFVGLAEQGYYDGLTLHRIMADFMIQGGDPEGTGRGGKSLWGEKFDGGVDEHIIHASGAIAYANSGSTATNGSQFYIVTGQKYHLEQFSADYPEDYKKVYSTTGGTPSLDGSYTVFGQVYQGLDVIYSIQDTPVYYGNSFDNSPSTPEVPPVIEYVKVGKYEGEELKWFISDYK